MKKTAGKRMRLILALLCLAVFLVSAGMLLRNVFFAQESRTFYQELEQMIVTPAPEEAVPPPAVKYGELAARNPDFIGWLSIEGTALNYPVMQRKSDKDYYLRRNFDGGYSYYGTPYMDEQCDLALSDNLIIYGHNMDNGTMFAELRFYTDPEYFKAHPVIRFDTLQEYGEWQVLAAFKTTADDKGFGYHRFIQAETPEEYSEFVAKCKQLSFYDTGVIAQYGEQLLTLSTCEYTRDHGRLVVVAKKIGEQK